MSPYNAPNVTEGASDVTEGASDIQDASDISLGASAVFRAPQAVTFFLSSIISVTVF